MNGMKKRRRTAGWVQVFQRSAAAMTRIAATSVKRGAARMHKPVAARRAPAATVGAWLQGVVMGAAGARRFRLFRPPDIKLSERLPLLVMLHGCAQDAQGFAASTRMNRIALRERFLVLYPEQDRLANVNGCWNWFDTGNGRAYAEVALIMQMVDRACLLYAADR